MNHTNEQGFPTRPQYMTPDEFRNLISVETAILAIKKKDTIKPCNRVIP
jgi:hypothetical protein